jgi:hypothetical protein
MSFRQPRPRKSYKPVLTWIETPFLPETGWTGLVLTTAFENQDFNVTISLRSRKTSGRNSLCYIDFYRVDKELLEPVADPLSWYNIRNCNVQRYKPEALAFAESLLLTPMSYLQQSLS